MLVWTVTSVPETDVCLRDGGKLGNKPIWNSVTENRTWMEARSVNHVQQKQ